MKKNSSAGGGRQGEVAEAGWLEQVLARMPEDCAAATTRLHRKAGEVLLRMGDKAESVFFLLSGRVASINGQIGGLQYRYASFDTSAIFGEFEAFAGYACYRGTLICETDCRFLSLPREAYLSWMRRDADTLFQRTCAISASHLAQGRHGRDSMFYSAEERLAACIVTRCRQCVPAHGEYLLKQTLQQMADCIGSSVRTVQRALIRLEGMGFLRHKGRNVLISEKELMNLTDWLEVVTGKDEGK